LNIFKEGITASILNKMKYLTTPQLNDIMIIKTIIMSTTIDAIIMDGTPLQK
jgi:hypothetical protein